MNLDLLDSLPDPQTQDFDDTLAWIEKQIAVMNLIRFTPELATHFVAVELKEDFVHECGPEAFPLWRKFFLATLLADWATYEHPTDRVDYARLKYIMTSAHRYTRLWCCRLSDGTVMPVGYTAWYPIAKSVYEGAVRDSASIDDRGYFMPLRNAKVEDVRYSYAFNINIIASLRNTVCSYKLIRACQHDLTGPLKQAHVLAVAVDDAGQKFLQMMKFNPVGAITVDGEEETLFARKPF
jgi:hypothetical protein